MVLIRPKHPKIYPLVEQFWNNAGGVLYIAHVITKTDVFSLGSVMASGGNNRAASSHPDQTYWARKLPMAALNAKGRIRVEIDCSLLPCDSDNRSCLVKVPQLLTEAGFNDIPMLIFSHRDETVGSSPMQNGGMRDNKRHFVCKSSTRSLDELKRAYGEHRPWTWSSATGHSDYVAIL